MTNHTLLHSRGVIGTFANRLVTSVARRITDLNARIDAQAPLTHHRIGAWEAATSPAAQHAVRVLRADAEKNAHEKDVDARQRVAGMLSENG